MVHELGLGSSVGAITGNVVPATRAVASWGPDDLPTDRRILAAIRKPERFGQAGLALFARTLDDVLARA